MAGKDTLSEYLKKQQMILMGKLAFRENEDVVRKSIFLPDTCELRPLPGAAKRGRPRARWPVQVLRMCINAVGSHEQLMKCWNREHGCLNAWISCIRKYRNGVPIVFKRSNKTHPNRKVVPFFQSFSETWW